MPKISVIMPVYNAEKYLNEAIDSILGQTFTDFEFIILDDGSSDASPAIVRSYHDPRIRFYVNERNMGVAATLNRGLDLATGEYIARMDADDISLPQRFAKQAAFLDGRPEVAVCGAGIELFGGQRGTRLFSQGEKQLKVDLLFGCCFAHPAVMMRGTVIGKNGLHYDTQFGKMEDYELWVRVSREHKLAALHEILLKYRVHPGQVTQNYSHLYREQDRALKRRLLAELGIWEERDLDTFCRGYTEVRTCEEKREYLALLGRVQKENGKRNVYDRGCLNSTIRTVSRKLLDRTSVREAKTLAAASALNPAAYILGRATRGSLRRFKHNGEIRRRRRG